MASETHRFTAAELRAGVSLSTGSRHTITVITYKLRVRLPIDPNDARTKDDKLTLIGGDVCSPVYSKTKTTQADLIPGDAYTDLLFTGLEPDVPYSLEIDPGQEGDKYYAFEAIPWSEISPIAT